MNSDAVHRPMEALPEESRLLRQARSGDADAFVQLYDAYVQRVYRYVYFRVVNDLVAEDITLHLFRAAWDRFENYPKLSTSFITWLYKLARELVVIYYSTDFKNHSFNKRTLEIMARFIEELELGRAITPSPDFEANTRSWLIQYLRFHPRHHQSPVPSWQSSWVIAVLIAALLVTGTAHAQSVLPGDIFYGWKRTSEEAWRTLSLDPVGIDIILSNRRLHEWIAVQTDPVRSVTAQNDYLNEVTKLKSAGNPEARARIIPALNDQKKVLNTAGLSTTQLENYLIVSAIPDPTATAILASSAEIVKTATGAPTSVNSAAANAPAEVSVTQAPTEVVPTAVPTEVVPSAVPTVIVPTEAPTEVVSPPTDVPTEVAAPPTEAPTDVAPPPPPTEAPTDVAPPPPPPTHASTDVPPPPPPATDAQPAPTDDPGNAPTDVSP